MELTNQVATLQDEVKLLKGEIKSILKEIRAAVLSRDNPFASDGPATFSAPAPAPPVAVEAPPAPLPEVAAPAAPAIETPPPAPTPEPQAPPAPEPPAPIPMPAFAGPPPAPVAAPPPPAWRTVGATAPQLAPEEDDLRLEEERAPLRVIKGGAPRTAQEPEPASAGQPWNIMTIAGLAVWAEDALEALGPRRFQFVLRLATFGELIPEEAREVLTGLSGAAPEAKDELPTNVNECLVVLRQLEAIVSGERLSKLPRLRARRHRRVR